MTLFLFILGILIALGIARYNESHKLFWTLLVAYTLGFAVTKIVHSTFFEKEQSENVPNQECPTQGLATALDINMCLLTNVCCSAPDVETQKLVSQDTPDFIDRTFTLSNVPGVTQWINLHVLPNPPNTS